MCFQGLRSCLIPWTKPQQGKNPEEKLCGGRNYCWPSKPPNVHWKTTEPSQSLNPKMPYEIVIGGSIKNRGIAALLYVHRHGSLLLAGFFSAKLRKHQVTWLPCEIEALATGAAIRHFASFIIQSPHTTEVLTDSRPCVQAYEKLKRGEFSASSRVIIFLSTVSRYSAHIRHIAGVENLPSDYPSRNQPTLSCRLSRQLSLLER